MNSKNLILTLGIALCLAAPVQAHDKEHRRQAGSKFRDYAQVIDVQPVFKLVSVAEPSRECWNESVKKPVRRHVRNRDSAGGTLVGGIIGGAIGKHFGGGDPGAVIAGTLVGAAIGHDASSQNQTSREYYLAEERRCHEYTEYRQEKQQDGYTVTYRYHGEIFTTHMDRDPGTRLRVRVIVEPAYR